MKKGNKLGRIRLPMAFDEAVSDFLKVKPPPKPKKKSKKQPAK
jgi:hypothetical protein